MHRILKTVMCGVFAAVLSTGAAFAETRLSTPPDGAAETSAGSGAFAEGSGILPAYDPGRNGTVTIDYRDGDSEEGSIAGAKFSFYRIGDYANEASGGSIGSRYVSEIGGIELSGDTEADSVKDAVFEFYKNKKVPYGVTGENGTFTTELEPGVYMGAETVPAMGHNPSVPFLFAVPSVSSDGENVTGWNYNITAYPKSLPVTVGTVLTGQGIHESGEKDDALFTDTVKLSGLVPGKSYTITGQLMDKASNTPVGTAVAKKITAEQSEETHTVDFHISTRDMGGKGLVAFEKLYTPQVTADTENADGSDAPDNTGGNDRPGELPVASHEDLTDEAQTVHVVRIGTTLVGDNNGKTATTETKTLTDTVRCTGLIPGNSYVLSGELYSKKTQKSTGIRKEVTFKATSATLDVKVPFDNIDLKAYADDSLVAFEKLYSGRNSTTSAGGDNNGNNNSNNSSNNSSGNRNGGVLIASHEDINDAAQTVSIKKPAATPTPTPTATATPTPTATATPTPSKAASGDSAKDMSNVKTGDGSAPWMYLLISLLAASAFVFSSRKIFDD